MKNIVAIVKIKPNIDCYLYKNVFNFNLRFFNYPSCFFYVFCFYAFYTYTGIILGLLCAALLTIYQLVVCCTVNYCTYVYYPDKTGLVVCCTVNYVYYPDKTGLVVCCTVNYVYYPDKTGLVVCSTVNYVLP